MADKPQWSAEAKTRIKKVPFFIRPLVKKKVEAEAKRRGLSTIEVDLLAEIQKAKHG